MSQSRTIPVTCQCSDGCCSANLRSSLGLTTVRVAKSNVTLPVGSFNAGSGEPVRHA